MPFPRVLQDVPEGCNNYEMPVYVNNSLIPLKWNVQTGSTWEHVFVFLTDLPTSNNQSPQLGDISY